MFADDGMGIGLWWAVVKLLADLVHVVCFPFTEAGIARVIISSRLFEKLALARGLEEIALSNVWEHQLLEIFLLQSLLEARHGFRYLNA